MLRSKEVINIKDHKPLDNMFLSGLYIFFLNLGKVLKLGAKYHRSSPKSYYILRDFKGFPQFFLGETLFSLWFYPTELEQHAHKSYIRAYDLFNNSKNLKYLTPMGMESTLNRSHSSKFLY